MNPMLRATPALIAVLLSTVTQAGVPSPFITPQPYVHFDDSPFSVLHGFDFCLETFEDGTLDVPGMTANGTVMGPSDLTDSVDIDDGMIDGSGLGGHSYFSGGGSITLTFPEGRTNGYPTKLMVAWTDGGPATPVKFEAFDADGQSYGTTDSVLHADLSNSGETAEDRSYALQVAGGISKVTISNTSGGIEIDHVQLDRCILCGDTNQDLNLSASDALAALRASVGSSVCRLCICDANNNASVTAGDALAILREAVDIPQAMNCPSCVFP
jgi:hypothetical protein